MTLLQQSSLHLRIAFAVLFFALFLLLGTVSKVHADGVILNTNAACAPYITTYHTYGNRGDDVRDLQRFLNVYNGSHIPETGYFGPITFNAVKNFQTVYGIESTGNQLVNTTNVINQLHCQFGSQVVGAIPMTVTQSATATCPVYTSDFTRRGDRSKDVAKLQLFLNIYRGAALPVTGYFGAQTENAVMQYQAADTIMPVSGLQLASTTNQINQDYCHLGGTQLSATSIMPSVVSNTRQSNTGIPTTDPSLSQKFVPHTFIHHAGSMIQHTNHSNTRPVVILQQESFSSESHTTFASILSDIGTWILHTGLWLIVALLIFLGLWNLITPEEVVSTAIPTPALLEVPHVSPPVAVVTTQSVLPPASPTAPQIIINIPKGNTK